MSSTRFGSWFYQSSIATNVLSYHLLTRKRLAAAGAADKNATVAATAVID